MSVSEVVLVSSWVLMVRSKRASITFTAGQIRETGLYEMPGEESLPGFGKTSQIAVIRHDLMEAL